MWLYPVRKYTTLVTIVFVEEIWVVKFAHLKKVFSAHI